MSIFRRTAAISSACLLLAAGSVACTGVGTMSASNEAEPQKGGTLKLLGAANPDHLVWDSPANAIGRAIARQLVSFKPTNEVDEASQLVPDVARDVPTTANGGITNNLTTYTFHIKQGVKWNTNPPRQVTAQDFVRGLKTLCNPARPAINLNYYTDTIAGMKEFCSGFLDVQGTPSAMARYIKGHDIKGLEVKDDLTLAIHLRKPTPSFLSMMALPFASAAPREYLQYVPDTLKWARNTISNGPYQVETYESNKRIVLTRNPAWDRSTDKIRHAYVERVEITLGLTAENIIQRIKTGTADLGFGNGAKVPPTDLHSMLRSKDSRLQLYEDGTLWQLAFNFQSENESGAMKKANVRRAINYAVDKSAVAQIFGGPKVTTTATQVLPESSAAHEEIDMYSTGNKHGDIRKARELLAEAGYGNGLQLTLAYPVAKQDQRVATTIQASLAKVGIQLKLKPVPQADYYSTFLEDASTARQGKWDIAFWGWTPSWLGKNARVYFVPVFYGGRYGPKSATYGINFGWYNDSKTNSLIERALSAKSSEEAQKYWHQAGRQIMSDAAFVPLLFEKEARVHSRRVENWLSYPVAPSVTNIWLAG